MYIRVLIFHPAIGFPFFPSVYDLFLLFGFFLWIKWKKIQLPIPIGLLVICDLIFTLVVTQEIKPYIISWLAFNINKYFSQLPKNIKNLRHFNSIYFSHTWYIIVFMYVHWHIIVILHS